MKIRRTLSTFLFLAVGLGTIACDDDDNTMPTMIEQDYGSLVEVAQRAGYNTLLTALDVAGLTSALEAEGPFTLLAPSDQAFASLDQEVLNDLLSDTELLAAVLTYHVIPGNFRAREVRNLSAAPTLNGKDLSITYESGYIYVDGARVVAADVEADNGTIHVIDRVILPEAIADIVQTAKGAGIFNTLLAAVEAAGLTDALKGEGPFTVFAPTDDAFAAIDAELLGDLVADTELLTAVLTYHVVPGLFLAEDVVGINAAPTLNGKDVAISVMDGGVMVDGANVIATDILTTNGVVHVIDQVILPEAITDIVQTAKGAGIFNTLLAAVEAAGLTDVLKGDGPFTVFAPTDEAFSAVPADALAALLADPQALASVLTYHVVPGEFRATDVLANTGLATANGAQASISLDGEGRPRIDDAIITATDIDARNGVIHVIDRVIFPQ